MLEAAKAISFLNEDRAIRSLSLDFSIRFDGGRREALRLVLGADQFRRAKGRALR
jgi:hypothetical protein